MRNVEQCCIVHSSLSTQESLLPSEHDATDYANELKCFILVDPSNRRWRAGHLLQLSLGEAKVLCAGEQSARACKPNEVIADMPVEEVVEGDQVLRVCSEFDAIESAIVETTMHSGALDRVHCATMGFDGTEALAAASDLRQLNHYFDADAATLQEALKAAATRWKTMSEHIKSEEPGGETSGLAATVNSEQQISPYQIVTCDGSKVSQTLRLILR